MSRDGLSFFRPISELQHVLSLQSRKIRINCKSSFSEWCELTSVEIGDISRKLGFNEVLSNHTHYTFEFEGKRYIVPAATLMSAIFRPFHGMAKYIFSPQGLDNLCMPHGNDSNPEILFFIAARAATGMQVDKAKGILNSLSWMHCFPSGRKMWSSALEHAYQGMLRLTLPKAHIQFLVFGFELSPNEIICSELRIRVLTVEELPFEEFSKHVTLIEFERTLHKSLNPKSKHRYEPDLSIPLRDGQTALTDAEWMQIKNIAFHRKRKIELITRRRIIDLLLQKLSQGVTWSGVTPLRHEHAKGVMYLSAMRADGRWDNMMKLLRELRRA